jgi:hypothetical protein
VREVSFTVLYQADPSGLYTIKKVIYDLVIQESLNLGTGCAGGTIDAKQPPLVQMKFAIQFFPYTEDPN